METVTDLFFLIVTHMKLNYQKRINKKCRVGTRSVVDWIYLFIKAMVILCYSTLNTYSSRTQEKWFSLLSTSLWRLCVCVRERLFGKVGGRAACALNSRKAVELQTQSKQHTGKSRKASSHSNFLQKTLILSLTTKSFTHLISEYYTKLEWMNLWKRV